MTETGHRASKLLCGNTQQLLELARQDKEEEKSGEKRNWEDERRRAGGGGGGGNEKKNLRRKRTWEAELRFICLNLK